MSNGHTSVANDGEWPAPEADRQPAAQGTHRRRNPRAAILGGAGDRVGARCGANVGRPGTDEPSGS